MFCSVASTLPQITKVIRGHLVLLMAWAESAFWHALEHSRRFGIPLASAAWHFPQAPENRVPQNQLIFEALGVSMYSLAMDVLHVMDLGITCYILGSILHNFCYKSPPDAEARCALLWDMIQSIFSESWKDRSLGQGGSCRITFGRGWPKLTLGSAST